MRNPLKPIVLGDIKSTKARSWDAFSHIPTRINLHAGSGRPAVQLTKGIKVLIAVSSAAFFILGSAVAPTIFIKASSPDSAAATSGSDAAAERQALEAQLKDLENQINQYEDQVVGYQKQGKSLKNEITTLNNKIAKLNLQIRAVNLTLGELDKKIVDTQSQIETTSDNIQTHKEALSALMRNVYENDRASLMEIFLKSRSISVFFDDLNSIALLQNNLRVAIDQIVDLQNQLKDRQDQFQLAKSDAESVREYEAAQKNEIAGLKDEKHKLLDITKGQETKYQQLLKATKATAAQIRSRIFQLLGGGELSFEQAYEYAKLAAGATGIRPALILAVLDRESALGQNVGKCGYKTAMSPSNQAAFLALVQELNLNPDVMTVSCPNRDGYYGGAMGPAQFVPLTWNLYKAQVAKVTGHTPVSPWNNADAFVATALYLKDAMTSCTAVYSAQLNQERCTAARYYAGGRWRSYLWTYGEAVISRAKSFEDDIATITG